MSAVQVPPPELAAWFRVGESFGLYTQDRGQSITLELRPAGAAWIGYRHVGHVHQVNGARVPDAFRRHKKITAPAGHPSVLSSWSSLDEAAKAVKGWLDGL